MQTPICALLCLAAAAVIGLSVPASAAPGHWAPRGVDLSRFRLAAFRSPDSFFRPGYMWVWNDRLTEEALRTQLEDMAAHGAPSVLPLPEPKDFRPAWMPTRLEPDYLTEDFMRMVKVTAREARRLGMRLWLYDEGGWPSGSVCGRLVREHPDLARQQLVRQETPLEAGQQVTVPPDCLAAFVSRPGETPRRVEPGKPAHGEGKGSRLLVFAVQRGGSLPDLLNPRATREFLRMTHDTYRDAIGEYFGTTVPLVFTDEPGLTVPPWTDGLAAEFRARYGYDLVERMPSLFEGDARSDMQTRIDYFDWWSRRFAEAYLGQIRSWCAASGIMSGGHLNGEDETLGALKNGFGNLMRALREMDVPGVDTIWRQIWPGKENHVFPKYASSVAHQEGRPWALTESYAVYGSGLTPEQMKWVVDYQMVRGVNLVDMVGYPLSTADWLSGGERPHFDPDNPLWRYLPAFHGYVGRMSYLLSLGAPAARVAVYWPMRDVWARGPHVEEVAAANDRLAHCLLATQRDFDFIDDDVLERAATRVADGKLLVGPMAYDTVCVSRTEWMPEGSRRRLEELAESGGTVLWVDPPDPRLATPGASSVSLADLPGRVQATVEIVGGCGDVRACARRAANGTLYFLTNEAAAPVTLRLRLPDRRRPVRLDPETGRSYRVAASPGPNGTQELTAGLPFAGSLVLWSGDSVGRPLADPGEPGEVVQRLNDGWTCAPVRSFELGEHRLTVREGGRAPATVALGDWRPVLGDAFSGEAAYEVRFTCTRDTATRARWLDLGQVRHACEAELNGRPLGVRLWQPTALSVRGILRPGANTLRIVVANTLANQYVHNKVIERWKPNQLGPYHPIALRFEPESLPSGLYGPVVLRGSRARPSAATTARAADAPVTPKE
jgi:hypothetical protein